MQFTVLASAAALIASVSAVSLTQGPGASVAVGSPQTIAWDNSQPAQLVLDQANGNGVQVDVSTISAAATSPFTWTPPSSITSGTGYTIKIVQNGQTNYWATFAVTGGAASSASVAPSSTASVSAAGYGSSSSSSSLVSTSAALPTTSSNATSVKSSVSAATPTPTGGAKSNGTVSSPTLSTGVKSTSSPSPSPSPSGVPASANGASSTFGSSSVALLVGIAAAMAYLN